MLPSSALPASFAHDLKWKTRHPSSSVDLTPAWPSPGPARSPRPAVRHRRRPECQAKPIGTASVQAGGLLESAGGLVNANLGASPGTPRAIHKLAAAVVGIGPRGRKPQHGGIARLDLHSAGEAAVAQDAVHKREVVAGHIEQQVMLQVIVHVIWCDEQPLQQIGPGRAGVAQGIVAVGNDGVLGDIADAGSRSGR